MSLFLCQHIDNKVLVLIYCLDYIFLLISLQNHLGYFEFDFLNKLKNIMGRVLIYLKFDTIMYMYTDRYSQICLRNIQFHKND